MLSRMLRCYVLTGLLVVAADICLVGAMLGCVAGPTSKSCKVSKPDPRIIQHEDGALDNPTWHCMPFGMDAKTKQQVWLCRNKIDGAKVMVSPVQ